MPVDVKFLLAVLGALLLFSWLFLSVLPCEYGKPVHFRLLLISCLGMTLLVVYFCFALAFAEKGIRPP